MNSTSSMQTNTLLIHWLLKAGFPQESLHSIEFVLLLTGISTIALAANWFTRKYLVRIIQLLFQKSSNKWDDVLMHHRFIERTGRLVPVLIVYLSGDILFADYTVAAEFIKRFAMTFFVFGGIRILDSLLKTVRDIYSQSESYKGKSIRSYTDAAMIAAYVMAAIFIVSIITDKSPWGILSILGGFTVVLMLVFKDTILGFAASLQLSGHDMIRVGDWIEMPKFGADGDVIDVSIHTVKVRNWDKTITTIPTYSLVSDAFKNWRGMSESGGRRIKRSIYIDMETIKFCSDEMLDRFGKIELISSYISEKQQEIDTYNQDNHIDSSRTLNGRRQTNIGVFRAYITAYLNKNQKVHKDMTFLVRHLQPTERGLPIEIYVFSNDQVWARYESIQADIFDHLLAAVHEFDLRIFQNPTGFDFRSLHTQQKSI